MAWLMAHRVRLSYFLCCWCLLASNANCAPTKWQKLSESKDPHVVPFLSLFFFDPNSGVAITSSSVERTSDGGRTWTSLIPEGNGKSFHALTFINSMTGFVVGVERKNNEYSPMILRTDDGGRNWDETNVKPPSSVNAVKPRLQSVSFCNELIGWATGADLIAYTRDGGRTWDTRRLEVDRQLLGIACISPLQAIAVGQRGLVLLTKDGGKKWNQQTNGNADLLRVRFNGTEGWILGGTEGTSVLLRSGDGGETWHPQSIEANHTLLDIYLNGNDGWIVGAKGTILYSCDAGRTWKIEPNYTTSDLTALFFLSPHEGWAGGDKRTLLYFHQQ